MEDIGESQLCHLSESLVASIHLLDQAHPVNDSNTWGWDHSAAGTFFSSSVARAVLFVIFHASRRRHEMYSGPARLCVCLPVPHRIPILLQGPGCNLGNGIGGCCLVVHCWADLQSVHGFRCCNNIVRMRNVSDCLPYLHVWFPVLLRFRRQRIYHLRSKFCRGCMSRSL